jgi:hypothetical protein
MKPTALRNSKSTKKKKIAATTTIRKTKTVETKVSLRDAQETLRISERTSLKYWTRPDFLTAGFGAGVGVVGACAMIF